MVVCCNRVLNACLLDIQCLQFSQYSLNGIKGELSKLENSCITVNGNSFEVKTMQYTLSLLSWRGSFSRDKTSFQKHTPMWLPNSFERDTKWQARRWKLNSWSISESSDQPIIYPRLAIMRHLICLQSRLYLFPIEQAFRRPLLTVFIEVKRAIFSQAVLVAPRKTQLESRKTPSLHLGNWNQVAVPKVPRIPFRIMFKHFLLFAEFIPTRDCATCVWCRNFQMSIQGLRQATTFVVNLTHVRMSTEIYM